MIKEFLIELEYVKGYSPNTIKSYETDLNLFDSFLKKDLLSVTPSDIKNFIKSNASKSDKTISRYITTLRMFYNFLEKKGYLKINPSKNISLPKSRGGLPEVLTIEEVDNLLNIEINTPFDYRDKCILEVLYSTGIRITELVNLTLSDINLDDDLIKVFGKGSKERLIPINDTARDYLIGYINDIRPNLLKKVNTDDLYLNNHGKKLSRQAVFLMIKKRALNSGIKKNISPHTLRHSFATHLLKMGADIRFIQELLGHSDISTTQNYTHIANQTLKDNYEMYNPRDN